MSAALFASLLLAAFFAGAIDAIGGGGGLIQVPALFAALPGARPATVLATSKLAGFFGTMSAAGRYLRSVRMPWTTVAPAIAVAALASLGGAAAVTHVSPALFRPLVPVMLVVVLIYTILHKDLGAVHRPHPATWQRLVAGTLLVALVGFYDGFFGPGAGSFLMLLFVRWYGFDFLHAAAAARVVNVATGGTALAWFSAHGSVLWPLGIAMALANMLGAQIGARVALRRGTSFVRIVFAAVVALLIARTAWEILRDSVVR